MAVTADSGGRELSQRLSKVETAIFRRKTILFEYYTIGRDAEEKRKVDPYHLLFRGGQFYLIGYSHERDDVRVFRVSRIRGKVGYSSKAEHDFNRPEDFDPRALRHPHRLAARRSRWAARASGSRTGSTGSRSATSGTPARRTEDDDGVIFETEYAESRQLLSWVLGLGDQARILEPDELVAEARERLELVVERHTGTPEIAGKSRRRRAARAGGRLRRPRRARRSGRSASPGWSRSRAS